MEESLLNRVILYIILSVVFLTACSPYGINGEPEELHFDSNSSTPEELEALENMKTFSITIDNFEANMEIQNNKTLLNVTETGYITKDQLIQIDYKHDLDDKNEPLTYIYILINQSGESFPSIEKECIETLGMLFTSLEVSYDLNELVRNVKENKIAVMDTEDVMVELTDNVKTIQMVISPK